ncbi:MAG TPA: hypothetical protein VMX97_03300 [Hyphomicrobiaceae bacterium]|nr:hypothetical protein [Hyphomicrobiaceae bacterium]
MKNRLLQFLLAGMFALAIVLPALAQERTPIVVTKDALAVATMTADGDLWATAQPVLNHAGVLISVRKSGTVAGCTLTLYTGQTAATATSAINDANATFSCATAVNKVVNNIDQYLQGTVSSWSGTGTITIYVTKVSGMGFNLNATLSAVTQGDGAATPGAVPWYTQGTDGTNKTPSADAQARARHVIPGNGTNADKQMLDGVGALGAGVKQVATLGTLSAAVASATMTQVVAVDAGARVLLGVILETATTTAGIVTVSTGTGTNCGTGTATKVTFGIGTATSPLPVGYYPVNALVAAGSAICLTTDAATTSARVLTQ